LKNNFHVHNDNVTSSKKKVFHSLAEKICAHEIGIKQNRIEWVEEFGNTSFIHILDLSSMEQFIINNIKTKNLASNMLGTNCWDPIHMRALV
jgi:hypothetical protein